MFGQNLPPPSALMLQARVAALSIILHTLVHQLIRAGALDGPGLGEMKTVAIGVANDMQAAGRTPEQVGGARIRDELESWFATLE